MWIGAPTEYKALHQEHIRIKPAYTAHKLPFVFCVGVPETFAAHREALRAEAENLFLEEFIRFYEQL